MSKARTVVSASVVMLASLVACSNDSASLDVYDGDGVTVCATADPKTARVIFAMSVVGVSEDNDVIVTGVDLVDSSGLEVLGYDFGDGEDSSFGGVGFPYEEFGPPSEPADPTLRAGKVYTVKVGLKASKEGGYAAGLVITYGPAQSSVEKESRTRAAMRVPPPGKTCLEIVEE